MKRWLRPVAEVQLTVPWCSEVPGKNGMHSHLGTSNLLPTSILPVKLLGRKGDRRRMTELIVTLAMSVSSILLFCYWFHFICRLILSTATSRDYAGNVVQAHQLCFPEAQLRLSHGATELDRLKEMLDRDYAVLARLMNRAGGAQAGIERRML